MLYKSTIDANKLASMLWEHLETMKDSNQIQRTKELIRALQKASIEASNVSSLAHSLSVKGGYEDRVDFFKETVKKTEKCIQDGKQILYEIAVGSVKPKMRKH